MTGKRRGAKKRNTESEAVALLRRVRRAMRCVLAPASLSPRRGCPCWACKEAAAIDVLLGRVDAAGRRPTGLAGTVAASIMRVRVSAGLTQKEVAERGGLSVSYVSMMESGRRGPTLETLERVAKALGVKAEVLVRGG